MGDFACNSMLYDFENHCLVDLTGHGTEDALHNPVHLRIPPTDRESGAAASGGARAYSIVFRWYWFRTRGGYELAPDAEVDAKYMGRLVAENIDDMDVRRKIQSFRLFRTEGLGRYGCFSSTKFCL